MQLSFPLSLWSVTEAEEDWARIVYLRERSSETPYLAPTGRYAADQPVVREQGMRIDDTYLRINLPPATQIRLTLEMDRHVNAPSYLPPGSEWLYV